MDKKTYEILFDESINEEFRKQYLIDEYHEYEREKYYKRKYKKVDILQKSPKPSLINWIKAIVSGFFYAIFCKKVHQGRVL